MLDPTPPIPAAPWTGRSIRADTSWDRHISPAAWQDIVASAANDRGCGLPPYRRPTVSVSAATAAEVASWLQPLAFGRGPGFVRVRGLDLDGLSDDEAAAVYWHMGFLLGSPRSQNSAGEFICKVADAPAGDAQRKGYRSTYRLRFHADYSEILGLLCLRPAKAGGHTSLISSAAVHSRLRERDAAATRVLHEQPYPVSRLGEQGPGEAPTGRNPIFGQRPDGAVGMFYNPTLIDKAVAAGEKLTDEQVAALDRLDEVVDQPDLRFDFALERGDIVWVNNFMVLHSRTEFEDFAEPQRKRCLLRLWLETDRPDVGPPDSVRYDYRFGVLGRTVAEAGV